MTAAEKLSEFMDARQIRNETGCNEATAIAIIRWCAQEKGRVIKVRPPEGRKTYVYREDVRAWQVEHTESGA